MSQQDSTQSIYERLINKPPQITVVSDHPLLDKEYEQDDFNLVSRMGPIYDVIRHPKTVTPMAIAVYGDWGTGKTSAMRWLHGLLEKSNTVQDGNRVRVKPVWFYPWKYDTKEDVWRGLIAEIIIKSINIENADAQTCINAAKQFGMFLGRSFINLLAGLSLKAKLPADTVQAQLKLEDIKDIIDDYRETSHPEKAYLNEFESTLDSWIGNTIRRGKERMVVFIDDLDRCMPEVALEVLEALKLYLNIKDLIFVVGVDKGVITQLVEKHYGDCGVDSEKCRHYLAKMFQIEAEVSPHENQIDVFLDRQLGSIEYWQGHTLDNRDREIFKSVILTLADRNPREVKRLLNSALMAGSGTIMQPQDGNPEGIRFNQALQLYFIRKILSDKYGKGSLVSLKVGDEFFKTWSSVMENANDKESMANVLCDLQNIADPKIKVPGYLAVFTSDKTFLPHLDLLSDKDLSMLLQIDYYAESSKLASSFEDHPVEVDATVRFDRRGAMAWCDLGELYKSGGRKADAQIAYQRAIEADPRCEEAWSNLADILSDAGLHNEAERAYRKLAELNPMNARAWYGLARIFNETGRTAEAEEAYRMAVDQEPSNVDSWNSVAYALWENGEFAKAEEVVGEALTINPDDSYSNATLGLLRFESDELEKGRSLYERAIDLRPDDLPLQQKFHFEYGRALSRNGHYDDARRELEVAKATDANYVPANAIEAELAKLPK